MNKQRVSHLKKGRVRWGKCGQVSLAIDKSQGGYVTDSHNIFSFLQEDKNAIRKLDHPLQRIVNSFG